MWIVSLWTVITTAGADDGVLSLSADGMTLTGPQRDSVALPCAARQPLVMDGVVWLACDGAVVHVVFAADGRLGVPMIEATSEPVHHLEVRGGKVVPVFGPSTPPVTAPPTVAPAAAPVAAPAAPAAAPTGTITRVDGRLGVMDGGTQQGFIAGRYVEVTTERAVTLLENDITETVLVGYGEVQAVSDTQAVIRMSTNQFPEVGAKVRMLEKRPSSYSIGPPRIGGQGFAEIGVRGILGAGFSSGALLAEAGLGYRFKIPLSVELRFDPAVLGGDDGGGFGNSTLAAVVGLDHQWFAIGGGGGLSMTDEGDVFGMWLHKVRFGPIDGLNFTAWIGLRGVPYDYGFGTEVYWEVDQIKGTWQIPVTTKPMGMWVIVRGQGGYLGGGGEAGIRIRARGNGARGTWGVTPLVGGFTWQEYEGSSYTGGPSFGVSFDAVF